MNGAVLPGRGISSSNITFNPKIDDFQRTCFPSIEYCCVVRAAWDSWPTSAAFVIVVGGCSVGHRAS